jgi:hypothetical protein
VAVALLAIAAVEQRRMAREVASLKAARESEVAADATGMGGRLFTLRCSGASGVIT